MLPGSCVTAALNEAPLIAISFIGIFEMLVQIRLAYSNSDISKVINNTFLPCLAIFDATLPRKIDLPILVSPANTYNDLPACKKPPSKESSNHSHVLGILSSTVVRSAMMSSMLDLTPRPKSVTKLILQLFSNLSKITDVSTLPAEISSAAFNIVWYTAFSFKNCSVFSISSSLLTCLSISLKDVTRDLNDSLSSSVTKYCLISVVVGSTLRFSVNSLIIVKTLAISLLLKYSGCTTSAIVDK